MSEPYVKLNCGFPFLLLLESLTFLFSIKHPRIDIPCIFAHWYAFLCNSLVWKSFCKHISCKDLSMTRKQGIEQGGKRKEQCPFYSSHFRRLPENICLEKMGGDEEVEFCCHGFLLLLYILHLFTGRKFIKLILENIEVHSLGISSWFCYLPVWVPVS